MSAVGYILYNIRQTAENWADRSYKAGLELNEENPGSSYHEIIQDFQNGYDVEARQKVSDREIAGKARMKKIHHYEKTLNAYLQNVEPHGVTVTNYCEESKQDGQSETLVFLKLNEHDDYLVAFIRPDNKIAFTSDNRVTTIADAKKCGADKIWIFIGNLTKPYTEKK